MVNDNMLLIRQKRVEDIPEFTLLVNRVWNETYRGIVPDDFLNNLCHNNYFPFLNKL